MDLKEDNDQDELLRSAVQWQYRKKQTTKRFGECVDSYLRTKSSSLKKNTAVVDAWEEMLPVELQRQCSIAGISGGILQIEVATGPYMHEMRLLSSERLEQLQTRCPRAGIKKIKLKPRQVSGA